MSNQGRSWMSTLLWRANRRPLGSCLRMCISRSQMKGAHPTLLASLARPREPSAALPVQGALPRRQRWGWRRASSIILATFRQLSPCMHLLRYSEFWRETLNAAPSPRDSVPFLESLPRTYVRGFCLPSLHDWSRGAPFLTSFATSGASLFHSPNPSPCDG